VTYSVFADRRGSLNINISSRVVRKSITKKKPSGDPSHAPRSRATSEVIFLSLLFTIYYIVLYLRFYNVCVLRNSRLVLCAERTHMGKSWGKVRHPLRARVALVRVSSTKPPDRLTCIMNRPMAKGFSEIYIRANPYTNLLGMLSIYIVRFPCERNAAVSLEIPAPTCHSYFHRRIYRGECVINSHTALLPPRRVLCVRILPEHTLQ